MKENLQENEVILHVDYSESYNNTQRDEIQSAYFGNSTFSIITASSFILNNGRELSKCSVAVVGESSDHSRIAALICVNMV